MYRKQRRDTEKGGGGGERMACYLYKALTIHVHEIFKSNKVRP